MSWVLYEFSHPKINAILRAARVCDKIVICDYSNETSSALFIGDWLLEKWKLKFMLARESWFPVDEKKGVVTIGLNMLILKIIIIIIIIIVIIIIIISN